MTVRRTFSLPDDVATQLDRAAGGNASAFVTAAIQAKVARDEAADRLHQAYGRPDPVAYQHWINRLGGLSDTSTPASAAPLAS